VAKLARGFVGMAEHPPSMTSPTDERREILCSRSREVVPPEKGFGFIRQENGEDVFVALLGDLGEGFGRSKRARRSSSRSPRVPRVCRPPTSPKLRKANPAFAVIVRPGSSGSRGFFVSAPDDSRFVIIRE